MQQTSELYRRLLANSSHIKRHRLFVDGLEYGHSDILQRVETGSVFVTQAPEIIGSLFSKGKPGIGSCVARQMDILFIPREAPPRMAELRLETQLVLQDPSTGEVIAESEWIPQGTYYIDTRRSVDLGDTVTPMGALLIHGYDAMLKTEQPYLDGGSSTETWPQSMPDVAHSIAERIGVEIDERSVIDPDFMVGYPSDYTMRELLGHIAAANGGNWVM